MSTSPEPVNGVLLVDKASGMTSHDVVAIARRSVGMKKIGHCGTLDPMATGLLILVLGRATKMSESLMAEEKTYEGTLHLGVVTSSQDREGEVLEEQNVPALSDETIQAAFSRYDGPFEQTPPMVSAIKKDGVRLYKLARQGKTVERPPRPVEVYKHEILDISLPSIQFRVECTKGFYVRTYAHDIGQDLGCGGHLSALRRTRSGSFSTEQSISTELLKNGPREKVVQALLSPEEALSRLEDHRPRSA